MKSSSSKKKQKTNINNLEDELNINDEYKEEKACEAYDLILTLRDKEVDQYSSKANLFIVTQSAIVAFAGNMLVDTIPSNSWSDLISVSIFCSLGLILSLICHRMLKGAGFWIDYYQTRLGILEPAKLKKIQLFSSLPSKKNDKPYSRLMDSDVVKRNQRAFNYYSTRGAIMGISFFFSILWSVIFILSLLTFILLPQ